MPAIEPNMADDIDDVDAMLEDVFNKKEEKSRNHGSKSRDRSRSPGKSRDKERRRSRSRDRKGHRRDRERKRSGSREKQRRTKSRERGERKRSRSRDRGVDRDGSDRHRRSKSKERRRRSRSRSRDRNTRERSPPRFGGGIGSGIGGIGGRFGRSTSPEPRKREASPDVNLTPEERDARTIFVMQLSQRVRARDVEEFFSSVGKIKDVRLIVCNKTRRFKGIAYVEFKEMESVALALGLNGQKLCGVPVIVQPSQAEKNRVGNYYMERNPAKQEKGPMRLYVGSLHFNINEEMLRGIFEPFGSIQSITLMMDYETGRSKGYGFVTYEKADDAKKAMEQMNGFELAGRPMKVGHVTENAAGGNYVQIKDGLDSEETDKTGIDLGATGRLALMAKLAEGTGMKLPDAANAALQSSVMLPGTTTVAAAAAAAQHAAQQRQQQQLATTNPPIATQCFMLTNMFDPAKELESGWDQEIRDDVIEECNKYGGVLHLYVDKVAPQGNVYVKCPTVNTAVSAVNALHGRWFAGNVITAAYVPLVNYHNLFSDAAYTTAPLATSRR